MKTRAERKAENRANLARWFPTAVIRARRSQYERAVARLDMSREDDRLARELNIGCGPGAAAMHSALKRAEATGRNVTAPGCTDNSHDTFLAIAQAALTRWHKQAAAIERAILGGKLAVRDRQTLVAYRGESSRIVKGANVYALVQLCAVIEANLGKPRAVRVTFRGKVNPQVMQNTERRAPGGVVPVANVTEFLPWVRAEVRRFHERDARPPEIAVYPARTFATV